VTWAFRPPIRTKVPRACHSERSEESAFLHFQKQIPCRSALHHTVRGSAARNDSVMGGPRNDRFAHSPPMFELLGLPCYSSSFGGEPHALEGPFGGGPRGPATLTLSCKHLPLDSLSPWHRVPRSRASRRPGDREAVGPGCRV